MSIVYTWDVDNARLLTAQAMQAAFEDRLPSLPDLI